MLATDVSVHPTRRQAPGGRQAIVGFDAVMKVHEYLATLFKEKGRNLSVLDSSTDCRVSSR